jgi:glycosyltransferase involved in cell wall biosynthesis
MAMDAAALRWTVAQIGAREHYAIPAGFHAVGRLRRLYTDIWAGTGRGLLKRGPAAARALAARHHESLPSSLVTSYSLATLWRQYRNKYQGTIDSGYRFYEEFGAWFGGKVAGSLARQQWDARRDVFWAFNTGALECVRLLKDRGVLTIVDQIDPGRVEEDMVLEEMDRFPGWVAAAGRIPESYHQRLHDEWMEAGLVMVNSQWSKHALVKQGVPAEKIFVVPVIYEAHGLPPVRQRHARRLKVLWLGQVNLRKGIQYVAPAARALPGVDFEIAGPLAISDKAVAEFPPNVKFLGRITRDRTADLYRQADVFILPTVSDGFALTQLEAMAQAVPVITTPNCGDVVTDGIDGLIVPARDSEALASAISRLDGDRALLESMSAATAKKLPRFSAGVCIADIEAAAVRALRDSNS